MEQILVPDILYYVIYTTVTINSMILAYYTGKQGSKATVKLAARYPKKRYKQFFSVLFSTVVLII